MLRSIIQQTLDLATLPDDLVATLKNLKSKHLDPTVEDWTAVLEDRVNKFDRVYIVLDGADECDVKDQRIITKTLSRLATTLTSRLKIFIASRESLLTEVDRSFRRREHLSTGGADAKPDIAVYVEETIMERQRDGDLELGDPSLLQEIKSKLIAHADGM